jgi:hypothetical protein
MCEHLIALENELKAQNIKETYRGQPWSDNCREWVYFDCALDLERIRKRYNFPDFISTHVNNDSRSGLEAGFVCDQCHDAIMGHHPSLASGKIKIL